MGDFFFKQLQKTGNSSGLYDVKKWGESVIEYLYYLHPRGRKIRAELSLIKNRNHSEGKVVKDEKGVLIIFVVKVWPGHCPVLNVVYLCSLGNTVDWFLNKASLPFLCLFNRTYFHILVRLRSTDINKIKN